MSVALEVHNTNAVEKRKREECELAGVPIIEIKVDMITPDCFDLDNEQNQYQCKDCSICIAEENKRLMQIAAEEKQREEYRIQIAAKEKQREEYRIQNEAEENERLLQKAAEEMKLQDDRLLQLSLEKEEWIKQEPVRKKIRLEEQAVRRNTQFAERQQVQLAARQRIQQEDANRTYMKNIQSWFKK
jgi:hypothetical protein